MVDRPSRKRSRFVVRACDGRSHLTVLRRRSATGKGRRLKGPLVPDGDRQSPTVTDHHLPGLQGGDTGMQLEAVEDEEKRTEVSVGDHQVQDQPHEGTLPPRPVP